MYFVDSNFTVNNQVLDGGDLDITFELFDPSGKRLVRDVRQEDGMHTVDTKASGGSYQLCFDNTFSMMTDKVTCKIKIISV